MKYTAVTVLETGVLRKQVDGGGWIPVPRWAALEWPCLWTRASFILQNQPFVPLFVVSSRGERKPISHRHTHATRIAKNQNFNTVRIVPPKIFLLLRHPKSPLLAPCDSVKFRPLLDLAPSSATLGFLPWKLLLQYTCRNVSCASVSGYNSAQSGDTEQHIWSGLHRWQQKDGLFVCIHCSITGSHPAKPSVTTGQLSSPSGGQCNMGCNLIAVAVRWAGKEGSHHERHLWVSYEPVFLWAAPREEPRARLKQESSAAWGVGPSSRTVPWTTQEVLRQTFSPWFSAPKLSSTNQEVP